MPFSAVVFDLDGVIADTETLQLNVLNSLLQPFGRSISKEEWGNVYVGTPIEEDLRRVHARFGLAMSLEELSARRRSIYAETLAQGKEIKASPGIVALIERLEGARIPLAIASGSPRPDVQAVLRAVNLAGRFRALATASDVARPKPAPDVYLLAAAQLAVRPADCIAIEDSGSGASAAKSAGMRVIAVPSYYTRGHQFSADAIASSFSEVQELLFSGRF